MRPYLLGRVPGVRTSEAPCVGQERVSCRLLLTAQMADPPASPCRSPLTGVRRRSAEEGVDVVGAEPDLFVALAGRRPWPPWTGKSLGEHRGGRSSQSA